MRWVRTVGSEFLGLFVDDAPFAAAIALWLVLSWLILPRLAPDAAWAPVVLFAGLGAILAGSAIVKARGSR